MTDEQLANAQNLLDQEYFTEAINQFSAVLDTKPDSIDAWSGIALAYIGEGQWLEGLVSVLKALTFSGYRYRELVLLLQVLDACHLSSYVESIEQALFKCLKHRWLEGHATEFLLVQLKAKYQHIYSLDPQNIMLDESVEQMLADPSLSAVVSRIL